MWLQSPGVCLRRSAYCSMHSYSNQLHGGLREGMALWRCSHSQSRIFHVKSSEQQRSLKYFVSLMGQQFRCGLSTREGSLSIKLDMPSREKISRVGWNWRGVHQRIGGAAGGLCFGFSVTELASAEIPVITCSDDDQSSSSFTSSTHGKNVYTDYSVTGIPGDGRCLFRSVVHGACIRSGKPVPSEDLQRELADELRAMVADEFVKRREETEWFIEGDFDTYVSNIRRPHVWGGEPELFIASHVLQMPITVYMHDEDEGGLITIAEYGQQYGKEDPIQVLYHGYGHYDALQIPAETGPK